MNYDRYLELYLAVGWAGGVIVPLNIRWSPVENEDAMRDCRAEILFVDNAFAAVGTTLAKANPGLGWSMPMMATRPTASRATTGCSRRPARCGRHAQA